MHHLLNIHELCKLLAKHILADNMLDEESIIRKSRIYMLSWQRTQSLPKSAEKLKNLHIDGLKFHIMKRHYEMVIMENINHEKAIYEINRLREIMDLIDIKNLNLGTEESEHL